MGMTTMVADAVVVVVGKCEWEEVGKTDRSR